MAIDPSLAAFVSQEFRYETAEDGAVKTAYASAQEIEISTQLTEVEAASLAADLLNETDSLAQVFEVRIQGTVSLSDFDGEVPLYTLDAPTYVTDSRSFRLIAVEVDYLADETTLTIRGSV